MSSNYHTPYVNGTTRFVAGDLNAPLSQLDTQITKNVSDIANHNHDDLYSSGPYDLFGDFSGVPGNSEVVFRVPVSRSLSFPSALADSQMIAGTAATAETIFSVKKNGVEFGTFTFAASGTVATSASASGASFTKGDILTIVGPASADATLADLGWSVAATREAVQTTTTTTTTSTTSSTTSSTTTSTSTSTTTSTSTSTTTSTTTSSTTSTTTTTTA